MLQSPSRRTRYIFYGKKMSGIESCQNSQKISQHTHLHLRCSHFNVYNATLFYCHDVSWNNSYSRQKIIDVLDSRGIFLGLDLVISVYYVVKYRQTVWHFEAINFFSNHVDSYVGIIRHVDNASKSSQCFKVNFELYWFCSLGQSFAS